MMDCIFIRNAAMLLINCYFLNMQETDKGKDWNNWREDERKDNEAVALACTIAVKVKQDKEETPKRKWTGGHDPVEGDEDDRKPAAVDMWHPRRSGRSKFQRTLFNMGMEPDSWWNEGLAKQNQEKR